MDARERTQRLAMIAVCVGWISLLPQAAQASGAESFSVPFDSVVEVSTCPDFVQESARLAGTVRVVTREATDAGGNITFVAPRGPGMTSKSKTSFTLRSTKITMSTPSS